MAKKSNPLTVETLKHDEATRKNIPTAEYQSVMQKEEQSPVRVAYERRNRDLDPQLVWRGKDEQDWSDLVVHAPPLYIQEKVHPKVLIDDLKRQTEQAEAGKAVNQSGFITDLFGDFNGLPDDGAKTEFYQHDAHWANRMILGDSLQVMASLAEREGLRGKVQCIYFDPPYGIKFNSNFQWSTTSRDVKDGNTDHITREPEQVKAFRDTWRDGIHSYLTYLRDRLTVARDLLTDSGSVFVQIGDENVHRVRAVMDEVFGDENFVSAITFVKNSGQTTSLLSGNLDYIIWFAKKREAIKYRQLFYDKSIGTSFSERYDQVLLDSGEIRRVNKEEASGVVDLPKDSRLFALQPAISAGFNKNTTIDYRLFGQIYFPGNNRQWKYTKSGMDKLTASGRLVGLAKMIYYRRFVDDFPAYAMGNNWSDTQDRLAKTYVVQTVPRVIERCILMTTDPGDLVLDPTCGSGTTAYVAEQRGRRWITIDTSRVALALARARIMGARYSYYLLADSRDGQIKEAEVTRSTPSNQPTRGNIRLGFVYERVPHVTLKSIANNAEIDVIWDKFQQTLEPLRGQLNQALGKQWQEWEIPRDISDIIGKEGDFQKAVFFVTPGEIRKIHQQWWEVRIARQKTIDASIAAKAEHEYLYDKPFEDKKKVRVAGPFTVESLSPHRVLAVDENDELIDGVAEPGSSYGEERDFVQMILENLKTAGVQQAHKEDKISFPTLTPWPGDLVCAEGRYFEGGEESGSEKRAAIFIGPEFGTVSRPDLVEAAREAGDSGFDVLIACAFNYDARSTDFDKLGRIPVLKARMNADLHMADDLKNTGKGNLFVIFGEPDIDILEAESGQVRVKVNGVDVFHPNTGEVRSDGAEGIACWFIDTDYNEESFFVRHAYFLGANDPYKALKTTLKAEINEEAWASLNSDTSRAFDKPKSGRIAVKVINHLGDEVMKVFRVV
ncbi:MAG: site-specific DNA-methyltransferase [Sulfuriferula sp.]